MKTFVKKFTSILVATSIIGLPSCATMFSGSKEQIHFQSTKQPGATILIDGIEKGKTPCSLMVKKKASTITYEMEGYKSKTIEIDKSVNGLVFLNGGLLLVWFLPGLVGAGVDIATGAAKKFDQKSYDINLEPKIEAKDQTMNK